MTSILGSPYFQPGGLATSTAITQFDVAYPDHPWAGITTKERMWYDPILRDVYRQANIFGQFSTFVQNLAARNAKTMTVTSLYDVHPDFNRIGLRDMYLPASHVDSRSQTITFERYGGKVAYDAYDDIISYWIYNGGNASALRRIVTDKLGQHMVDVQDLLLRNAYFSVPFKYYTGNATNFATLTADSVVSTSLLNEIHLGMKYRGVPYARTSNGSVGTIVCVTSPGVLFDLQNQTDPNQWLWPMAYADPARLLNYEVGTYRNIRFVETPKCTLFNAGAIQSQVPITTAINSGDGAPDPQTTLVDATWAVGQPGATHYIQLGTTATGGATVDATYMNTNFKVGDIVTVHIQRTSDFGVTNGVDFRDGKLSSRRIVSVDASNRRLSFDMPIMVDMNIDLGSGVYAYVTKGVHVHAMVFIGGPDGIVMGVGRPPRLHMPPTVDDFDSIFRFSWDSYQGYVNYNPNVLEVVFTTASFRYTGQIVLPFVG